MRFAFIFGLASIATVTSARAAHALGPVDVEVAAKGGVATEYSGGQNPLGFGLGGRAGVVLFGHLYGGVNLLYSFGTSETYPAGVLVATEGSIVSRLYYTESIHMWMYGVEAGWGFKPLDNVTIRPQVGVGNASFSYSCPTTLVVSPGNQSATTVLCSSHARNNLYVEPGVTVLVALGTLFLGGDANFLVFPGLDEPGSSPFFITLHGQVGVKF